MTTDTLTAIADAVAADLRAASLSLSVPAVRLYLPKVKLADLQDLRVSVVPRTDVGTRTDRTNRSQQDYQIDVGIQRKLDYTQPEELEAVAVPLMRLREEIADFYKTHNLGSGRTEKWIKSEQFPYSPEHLEKERVFLAVVTFTFRGFR
jgi:hypothetical protein